MGSRAHAPEYGFILRYPEDKTEITGITYEPWHFRYVGKRAAREITERGVSLEEYLEWRGRRMLSNEKVAHRLSRMLGRAGRSRAAAAAVAFAALAAVVAAGMAARLPRGGYARGAHAQQPRRGDRNARRGGAAFADSERSGEIRAAHEVYQFVGGVVTNMEVSPRRHLSQFSALLDAAEDAGATILDFDCDAGGRVLTISCTAPDGKSAGAFAQLLRENGYFRGWNARNCPQGMSKTS